MKKRTKRMVAMVVCVAMFLACISVVAAAKVEDPYADIKASIYQQLEMQNALHHYEIHVAELIPDESQIQLMNTNNQSWDAPNGGTLFYSYDWTYRGEDGYVDVESIYYDEAGTNKFLAGEYSVWRELVEFSIGQYLAYKLGNTIMAGVSVIGILEAGMVRSSIEAAGNHAKVSNVYDSISGTCSTVAIGWDSYSTVTLNRSDAYDVHFEYST